MSKKRTVSIKYTSREFDTIKQDLIEYIKRYYPNTYRDFNEASFGSLMVDTVAYVGDILSFYIDYQANEMFLDTASEYDNIIRLGRQFGHKFTGAPSSFGTTALYIMVPDEGSGIGPDLRYMPILKRGASFTSSAGTSFILTHDVHFGSVKSDIRVARVDETTGNPTHYAVKTYGQVVSGVHSSELVDVGTFEKFKKISLSELDISEIVSVTDSEGNDYFEVDNMSQNVIYKGVTNRSKVLGNTNVTYAPGDQAAEILKPVVVPRRFVVNRNRRTTELTFGASSDMELPEDYISEPQTTILDVHGKNYIQDTSFDPTRMITSDKFGVGPANTALTIEYRVNTVDNVNIRTGQLNSVNQYVMEFDQITDLQVVDVNNVRNSLEIDNEEPIIGDVRIPDTDELRHRIRDTYSMQNRAVTQQDYESYVYQMPSRFGAVKRCRIMRDHDSLKRNLNLYLVSENQEGHLIESNDVLKQNVKTWLNKGKMINDTIDILDARVVNFTIEFVAVGSLDRSKFEILEGAKERLIQRFSRVSDIGEPFFITDIHKELRNVEGLLDVTDVNINLISGNTAGRKYSNIRFDVNSMTSADERYIEMPRNVIYEIRFPEFDIKGVIV